MKSTARTAAIIIAVGGIDQLKAIKAQAESRIIHRIADSFFSLLVTRFLKSISVVKRAILRRELLNALQRADLGAALDTVPIHRFSTTLQPALEKIVSAILGRSAEALIPKSDLRLGLRFDITNPRAVDFIRSRAAEFVTNVSEDTRIVLRGLIERSFTEGLPPARTARLIEQHIGLLPRHAEAVTKLRAQLASQGVDPGRLDKLSDRYAARLLKWRARNMARTETMMASNFGELESWRQRQEAGLLPSDAQKIFIVTPDERLCPECAPLEGETVGINEAFSFGGMMPPVHASCRCTAGIS